MRFKPVHTIFFNPYDGNHVFLHHTILSDSRPIEKANLVVVFQGRHKRVQAAYALLDAGYASKLAVSPASRKQLEYYDRQYQPNRRFDKIIEDKARTTFENALHTRNIIKSSDFKNVILAISGNHIAAVVLAAQIGTPRIEKKIQTQPIHTRGLDWYNWYRHSTLVNFENGL